MDSTEEKVSLRHVIKSVLKEKKLTNTFYEDSNIRALQRKFKKLIEKLGCDSDVLKPKGNHFEFKQSEVPFIKVILLQLHNEEGMISDFVNDENKKYSYEKVHGFIQLLLDEAEKDGMTEIELKKMAVFLSNIFLASPLRSIESCHRLIDALAANLHDLTSTQQADYLIKIEHLLKKEVSLRIAESAIQTKEIAKIIEFSKELVEDDIGYQNYYGNESEVMYEYTKRDREILKKIQEDDALRKYIENTMGKKAEDIFNYAALEI